MGGLPHLGFVYTPAVARFVVHDWIVYRCVTDGGGKGRAAAVPLSCRILLLSLSIRLSFMCVLNIYIYIYIIYNLLLMFFRCTLYNTLSGPFSSATLVKYSRIDILYTIITKSVLFILILCLEYVYELQYEFYECNPSRCLARRNTLARQGTTLTSFFFSSVCVNNE